MQRILKRFFENGEYIIDLENRSIKLKLKFDGYEFIRICEISNKFHLKDENLVFIYKRDDIFNKNMPQIISLLDNYRQHFIALKTAIESLNTSNVPTFFENEITSLIENESKKHNLAEDKYKEKYFFETRDSRAAVALAFVCGF